MEKFFYFLKNLKNKLNIKLMEILLEAEKTKFPKEVINNLEDFFELFDELKWFEKIVVGIIFFLSTAYLFFWIVRVYSLIK